MSKMNVMKKIQEARGGSIHIMIWILKTWKKFLTIHMIDFH